MGDNVSLNQAYPQKWVALIPYADYFVDREGLRILPDSVARLNDAACHMRQRVEETPVRFLCSPEACCLATAQVLAAALRCTEELEQLAVERCFKLCANEGASGGAVSAVHEALGSNGGVIVITHRVGVGYISNRLTSSGFVPQEGHGWLLSGK